MFEYVSHLMPNSDIYSCVQSLKATHYVNFDYFFYAGQCLISTNVD